MTLPDSNPLSPVPPVEETQPDHVVTLSYASSAPIRYRKYKRLCLYALWVAAAFSGVADAFIGPQQNLVMLLLSGVFSFSTLIWIISDAAEHEKNVRTITKIFALLIPPLGFIAYCLARRRMLTLLLGLLVFFSIGLIFAIASEGTRLLIG